MNNLQLKELISYIEYMIQTHDDIENDLHKEIMDHL